MKGKGPCCGFYCLSRFADTLACFAKVQRLGPEVEGGQMGPRMIRVGYNENGMVFEPNPGEAKRVDTRRKDKGGRSFLMDNQLRKW